MGKPGSRRWTPHKGKPATSRLTSGHVAKVSNILKTREGCDNVSKERVIAQHVENYLENENHPQMEADEKDKPDDGNSPAVMVRSPTDDPEFLLRHMTGTDFVTEQRGMMSVQSSTQPSPPRRHFSESIPTHAHPSPESSTYCGLRKPSLSGFSASNPATPTTYTSPSTAPPTPSTLNPLPANSSTPAQASLANRKRPLVSRSPTPIPLLQNDLTIEEVLIQHFVRLDGSGLFFGMVPGIPPLIWDTHKVWHLPIPPIFTDFPSAQQCWDFLMDRTLQFYRRTLFNRRYAPSTSDPPAVITKQYIMHTKQLALFDRAFQPLLHTAILPDGTIANPAALILSLNQKCTAIILGTVQNESEMMYDEYNPDFKYIVETCTRLVSSQDSTQLPRNTRFSFDTGIVPPLHVTASKCRDPVIRREAINLLFSSPRQEGMWDSVLSARIGRWLAACEEDGLPPPPLPPKGSPGSSDEMSSYPSPPHHVEDTRSIGGWESGRRISEVVIEMHGEEHEAYGPGAKRHASMPAFSTGGENGNGRGKSGGRKRSAAKNKEQESDGWIVPEGNRVQLMVVDFHVPERYIKVKCQRALVGKNGRREERETVIAW